MCEKPIDYTDLAAFLASLRDGCANVLALLHLDEAEFHAVDQTPPDAAPELLKGCIEVKAFFQRDIFKIFKSTYLYKYHARWTVVLRTTTDSIRDIEGVVNTLQQHLGRSEGDPDLDEPFTGFAIAVRAFNVEDMLMPSLCARWTLGRRWIRVEYTACQQLALSVTQESQDVEIGAAIPKIRGIWELLETDFIKLFHDTPKAVRDVDGGGGHVKEYSYLLPTHELGIFDLARIRQFSPDKDYHFKVRTDIFLCARRCLSFRDKVGLINLLFDLYGPTACGVNVLDRDAIDKLAANQVWEGFGWYFNHQHAFFRDGYMARVLITDERIFAVQIVLLSGLPQPSGKR